MFASAIFRGFFRILLGARDQIPKQCVRRLSLRLLALSLGRLLEILGLFALPPSGFPELDHSGLQLATMIAANSMALAVIR